MKKKLETGNNLNENLVIDKEITYDRMQQFDHVLLVMKNIGKNSMRGPCDSLHFEKNNKEEFTVVKKKGRDGTNLLNLK